jgi:hypothetical protein
VKGTREGERESQSIIWGLHGEAYATVGAWGGTTTWLHKTLGALMPSYNCMFRLKRV